MPFQTILNQSYDFFLRHGYSQESATFLSDLIGDGIDGWLDQGVFRDHIDACYHLCDQIMEYPSFSDAFLDDADDAINHGYILETCYLLDNRI